MSRFLPARPWGTTASSRVEEPLEEKEKVSGDVIGYIMRLPFLCTANAVPPLGLLGDRGSPSQYQVPTVQPDPDGPQCSFLANFHFLRRAAEREHVDAAFYLHERG
jgi:hypothetical protein